MINISDFYLTSILFIYNCGINFELSLKKRFFF